MAGTKRAAEDGPQQASKKQKVNDKPGQQLKSKKGEWKKKENGKKEVKTETRFPHGMLNLFLLSLVVNTRSSLPILPKNVWDVPGTDFA